MQFYSDIEQQLSFRRKIFKQLSLYVYKCTCFELSPLLTSFFPLRAAEQWLASLAGKGE
jgi:hypothetical protein